jgi:hypothetical protein
VFSCERVTHVQQNTHNTCIMRTNDTCISSHTYTVQPIFKAALEQLEAIVMQGMHQLQTSWAAAADISGADKDGDKDKDVPDSGGMVETSPYVTELANALAVFRSAALQSCRTSLTLNFESSK